MTVCPSLAQETVFDVLPNDQHPCIDYDRFTTGGGGSPTDPVKANPKDSLVKAESKSQSPTVKPKLPPVPLQKQKTEKADQDKGTGSSEAEEQTDESILSFNFLYYIIQKYKLQDIVE